jgi:hypothetical protein
MLGRAEPRSAARRSLRTIRFGNDYCYAVYSNVVFGLERSEPTVSYIDGFNATILEVAREAEGHGVGLMVVIHADSKPPTDDVRKHIVRTARGFAPHVRAFAHVVEGEGFLSAAKRAAMTFIVTTARFGFPLKVFRNVPEAMPWLLSTLGENFMGDVRHDQLTALVEDLRKTQFANPGSNEPR